MANVLTGKTLLNSFGFMPSGNKFSYRNNSNDDYYYNNDQSTNISVSTNVNITDNTYNDSDNNDGPWTYEQWIDYERRLLCSVRDAIIDKEKNGFSLVELGFIDKECEDLGLVFTDKDNRINKMVIKYEELYE